MKSRIVFTVFMATCLCTSLLMAVPQVQVTIDTDRPDAIYQQGQPITFLISVTEDGKPVVGRSVSYRLTKDGALTLSKGKITLTAKPVAITGTLNEPGFVKLFVNVPGHLDFKNRPRPAVAGAAVAPQLIKPSMPTPDDFDTFWEMKKKLVLASPMKPVLTPVQYNRDDVLVYDLQLNCPDGQGRPGGKVVSGYFAIPKNAQPGQHPAILFPHAAGVRSANLNRPVNIGAARGMIALDFNAHGIANGKPKSFYTHLAKGQLKGYAVQGREDRQTSYFLGMYMRLYRAIQFLKSRPEWDGKTLIIWGSSQGGGQTLVAGGLDSDITLLLAGVPAMCDHTAPVINRKAGWPQLLRGINSHKDKTTWDKVVHSSQYFDAVNFATHIKARIIMSVGFCDVICAPTSVYAAYNAIPGETKQIFHGLKMGHQQSKKVWRLFEEAALKHTRQAMAK